jgi:hypothetical protein
MIARQTTDSAEIKRVMCHPDIYPRISDDTCPPADEFEPPVDRAEFIGGYLDGEIFGLMIYHRKSKGIFCHLQVLPEYRQKYTREFTRMALAIGLSKNAHIYAEIPDCYPEVINLAKKYGFKPVEKVEAYRVNNGETIGSTVLRCDHERGS